MNLTAGFGQLRGAEFDVSVLSDAEVVVGFDFDFALGFDGQVFFGFELGKAVGLDCVVTLVADADSLVVLDVFVPVAFGVQVDRLLAFLSSMRSSL